MIKIAVFDTKPYDIPSFEKYGEENNIKYKFFETKLNEDTAELAFGYDGVCAFVNDTVDKKVIDKQEASPYIVCVDSHSQSTREGELTDEEQRLLACVDRHAVPIDEVAAAAGQPTAMVLRTLTKMAMRGLVIIHPGKLVSRK
jgi:predicted Rossmann fold nucleotide-binding protein DprA/Smf involved in DNA uptake